MGRRGVVPRGIALTIGLNTLSPEHYVGGSFVLETAEADATVLAELARARGLESTALLGSEARRDRVLAVLQRAAETLQGGDLFFLSYSGGGSQLPDSTGTEEDGLTETWCLHDGMLPVRAVYAKLSLFRENVRVFLLTDTCFTATVARIPYDVLRSTVELEKQVRAQPAPRRMPRFRMLPQGIAVRTYQQHRDSYQPLLSQLPPAPVPPMRATVIHLASCQDHQLAEEGEQHSLFIARLLEVWKEGQFKGGHRALSRSLLRRMPPTQSPMYEVLGTRSSEFERQSPLTV